jgi:hypothetical protein
MNVGASYLTMGNIEENKHCVLQMLSALHYEFDEVEETILASKYCQVDSGGVLCLLVECGPPFDRFTEWGGLKPINDMGEVERLVSALNSHLSEMIDQGERVRISSNAGTR